VLEIVDQVLYIDNYSYGGGGRSLSWVRGRIEFKDVEFTYLSQAEAMVLYNLHLTITSTKMLAVTP
jgi:ATP-binding cassette, subfamily B (MDR/TAP), member 1